MDNYSVMVKIPGAGMNFLPVGTNNYSVMVRNKNIPSIYMNANF